MATESLKIVIGADLSPATAAFKGLGDTLRNTGQQANAAFSQVGTAASKFSSSLAPAGAAMRDVADAGRELGRTGPGIDAAAASARNLSNSLKGIGRAPLQDINAYKDSIIKLKDAIRSGLTSGITFKKVIEDIPPAANNTANALRKIPPGANAAGFALTNVGRVAQDLPFGFIGIQNNLNPLLESFQRLKQETGSTGGALKALGSSLIGPAGIGLALSAVSAAFVIFQNGISGFNKKSKEAKESADELAKSIRDIGSITGEATASVQGEIAQVQALAGVISSSNRPYADRKRALEDLKEINKSYFGDLRLEDSLTGKLTAAVNEYSKALVNSAIQKAFVDEIAQVSKASAKAGEDVAKARDAVARARNTEAKAQQQLIATQTKGAQSDAIGAAGSSKVNDALTERAKRTSQVADAEKGLRASQDVQTKLAEQRLQLESQLNTAIAEGLKFKKLSSDADGKNEDALKKRIDALKQLREEVGLTNKQQIELVQLEVQLAERDGIKLGFTKEEIKDQVDAVIKKAFPETGGEFVASNLKIRVAGELDFSKVKIDTPEIEPIDIAGAVGGEEIPSDAFDGVINSIRSGAARAQGALEDAKDGIASIAASIQDAIVSAFDGLGAALGDALSGGGFSGILAKFGETVLKIIGGVLQDIGKQIVVASKLVATLKKVLSSVGLGAASLVVGLALVALGGVLKNIKFSTPQFEKGGIASGPRSGYLATLHGTELIIPMNKIDKRPASATGVQGGASGMVILQPSLSIDGRSIKVMLNRIDRTDNRIF